MEKAPETSRLQTPGQKAVDEILPHLELFQTSTRAAGNCLPARHLQPRLHLL